METRMDQTEKKWLKKLIKNESSKIDKEFGPTKKSIQTHFEVKRNENWIVKTLMLKMKLKLIGSKKWFKNENSEAD